MITSLKKRIKFILSWSGFFQKPSFLILGAQKAGTTALHEILSQHPKIHGSNPKEVHFFDAEPYHSSYTSYHSCFKLGCNKLTNFEATPRYLAHPDIPERILNYNPNLKFIVLLREPVSRALSAWRMYHHEYEEGPFRGLHDPRSFQEAILEDLKAGPSKPLSYLSYGLYAEQIRRYLHFFDRSQFLFIESNELKTDFEKTIHCIFDFLEVSSERLTPVEINKSVANDRYPQAEKVLRSFYKEHNEALYKLIEKRYDW